MAIRALVSLTKLQAFASVERITASTSYSKYAATEIITTGIWAHRAPTYLSDLVVISDEFSKAVEFTRVFNDQILAYDTIDIDRDGPNSRIATDSFGIGDHLSYNAYLDKQNLFSLEDYHTKGVVKQINDSFALDDPYLLQIDIDKDYYSDKDAVFSVSDVVGLTYEKSELDSFSVADSRVLHPTLGSADSIGVSDEASWTVTLNLIDTFTLDSAPLINKDFYGTKGNIFSLGDTLDITTEYSFTDSFGIGDQFSYAANLPYSDSLGLTDVAGVTITKPISDSFALDDLALINNEFIRTKDNVMSVEDQIYVVIHSMRVLNAAPLNTLIFN